MLTTFSLTTPNGGGSWDVAVRVAGPRTSRLFHAWLRAKEHPARLRLIYLLHRVLGQPYIVVPYLDGTRLIVDPFDYIGQEIIQAGSYEHEVHDLISAHLPSQGVFVDIGSHYGSFTIPLARRCRAAYAVDANPLMIELLRRSTWENRLSTVTIVHAAVHEYGGTIELFLSHRRNTGQTTVSKEWADVWPAGHAGRILVPTITLEALMTRYDITRIDCMKIDAEGVTGHIIHGGEAVLDRVGSIVMEGSPDEDQAITMLEGAGFRVSRPLRGAKHEETTSTILAER